MSLEQVIQEQTLATRDLAAAIMQLAATTHVQIPASFAPAIREAVKAPATFNQEELAGDPIAAHPTPAPEASPAPVSTPATASLADAPAATQEKPVQSGREYSQSEFLAIMKAYANGKTADEVAVPGSPETVRGFLAASGKANFREVPPEMFAGFIAQVPAEVIAAVLK